MADVKIYTSYYARCRNGVPNAICIPVSTGVPKWFQQKNVPLNYLAPGWDLVNGIKGGTITEEEYLTIYRSRLAQLNRKDVIKEIETVCDLNCVQMAILLCYEVPEDFCHRHTLAEWLDCNVEEMSADIAL